MHRPHQYWVYFLTNKGRTVLYTGVTNDLQRRLFEHRTGKDPIAFTWQYQCWTLVYFETFKCVGGALYNLDAHLDRVETSAEMIGLRLPMTRAQLVERVIATVRAGSEAAAFTIELSAEAVHALGIAVGTTLEASVVAGGWLIACAGEALAFVPDATTAALIHHRMLP